MYTLRRANWIKLIKSGIVFVFYLWLPHMYFTLANLLPERSSVVDIDLCDFLLNPCIDNEVSQSLQVVVKVVILFMCRYVLILLYPCFTAQCSPCWLDSGCAHTGNVFSLWSPAAASTPCSAASIKCHDSKHTCTHSIGCPCYWCSWWSLFTGLQSKMELCKRPTSTDPYLTLERCILFFKLSNLALKVIHLLLDN